MIILNSLKWIDHFPVISNSKLAEVTVLAWQNTSACKGMKKSTGTTTHTHRHTHTYTHTVHNNTVLIKSYVYYINITFDSQDSAHPLSVNLPTTVSPTTSCLHIQTPFKL